MEIYLDNAATTRPVVQAVNAARVAMEEKWHNPSALYGPSVSVSNDVNTARRYIGSLFGAKQVIFTSGGTEANNLAIHSAIKKNAHFICSKVEHSSVYEKFVSLREMGYEVDFISPREDFCIHPQDIVAALRPNTALISIMHVNSETGAVNDIASIARAIKRINARTLLHVDGVQAFLKQPIEGATFSDLYSISAHKIGGLKGCGALVVMGNVSVKTLTIGGSQEGGLRGGTENTVGILAFHGAVEAWMGNIRGYHEHMNALMDRLIRGLKMIDGCVLNLPPHHSGNILNASFIGVRGEVLLHALEEKGIYIGVGSACSSKSGPSRVLSAQGFDKERLGGAVRISICPQNTFKDVNIVLQEIEESYKQLKVYRRR